MLTLRKWLEERDLNESLDKMYPVLREDLTGMPGYVLDQWSFTEGETTYTVRFQNSPDFGKKVAQLRFGVLTGKRMRLNIGKVRDIRMFMSTLIGIARLALDTPTSKLQRKNHGLVIVMPEAAYDRIGVRTQRVLGRAAKRLSPVMKVHPDYTDFYPQASNRAIFLWRASMKFSTVFSAIPEVEVMPEPAEVTADAEDTLTQPTEDVPPEVKPDLVAVAADEVEVPEPASDESAGMDILKQTPGTQQYEPPAEVEPYTDDEINRLGWRAFVIATMYDIAAYSMSFGPDDEERAPFNSSEMRLSAADLMMMALYTDRNESWLESTMGDRYQIKLAVLMEGFRPKSLMFKSDLASEEAKAWIADLDLDKLQPIRSMGFKTAERILLNARSIVAKLGETVELRAEKKPDYQTRRVVRSGKSAFGLRSLMRDDEDPAEVTNSVYKMMNTVPDEHLNSDYAEIDKDGWRSASWPSRYKMPEFTALINAARQVYEETLADPVEKQAFLDSLPPRAQAIIDGKRSRNHEVFKTGWINSWAMTGGSGAQKDANTALRDFGVNAQVSQLWGVSDKLAEELPGHVRSNLEEVYHRTQDYFRTNFKNYDKKTITLYRGVGVPGLTEYIPGALESWSTLKGTANKFAKMMAPGSKGGSVLKAKVPVQHIWGTWETLKPDFPPEDMLKGKKEHIVMGGTFATTELSVLASTQGDETVLPFLEWIAMKEQEEGERKVRVIDANATKKETTATGLEPGEIGMDKLSDKGHEAERKRREKENQGRS